MANAQEQLIQPDSITVYQFEEKSFTLSPNTYDIGTYLKLLNIKPFQKINIKLKEGNYVWNENYVTPENTTIYMEGEKYQNGGRNNVVSIIINQKNTKVYEGKDYQSVYTRTKLTAALHKAFGFCTSKQILPVVKMRNIISQAKK